MLLLNHLSIVIILSLACHAAAQSEMDAEPINYTSSIPTDRVNKLAADVASGETTLEWRQEHGWLTSILDRLEVPRTSQTLVFSKTSKQFRHITPSHPRAIYFNDDVYVGWVDGGDIVEIGAVDPKLGAVFYSVDQKRVSRPVIKRDNGECMSCHDNGRTQQVPGFLVRSVYTKSDGQPEFRLGSLVSDHSSTFRDRFGGWYATGSHGEMRHRGNTIVDDTESTDPINRESGANLSDLPAHVRSKNYLEPSSDIVALMLLEHQTQMHNFVTKAGYTARKAVFQQEQMNTILDRPAGYKSDSTIRRINSAAEQLVEYLFFSGEFGLKSPVKGNTNFASEFASAGIRDSKGRSLRDLDLSERLLKHPCSYLVYSDSFRALPPLLLTRVKQRMLEVLTGRDESEEFVHLSHRDRRNILQILTETHPLFTGEKS